MKLLHSILIKLFAADMDGYDKYWSIRSMPSSNRIIKQCQSFLWRRLMVRFGAFIPLNASISRDVVFPHGMRGVFISEGASIGHGCTIFQQVTIGSNTLEDSARKGAPIIGNNCYIGCGAKIIGRVRVGNNVRIGANCVVVEDIPNNSTVVLTKPLVIHHDSLRDNSYKQWIQ